ncbi:hypothetical protein Rsub_11018 [Raphidocelis subcapitata]|uniref:Oxidation resistance protein 1 n=1 Tax=Raphidocelis subcapitata TaxID=307507 RepID=A0A2V0PBY0_9CHLO|nr:hypothetical protein Rsub_11018 [Raphidocelis subcapitata]|eukprot:GBF97371.1 hypothetical protein Rsub_11018 [Raphidocelis subcapitata]
MAPPAEAAAATAAPSPSPSPSPAAAAAAAARPAAALPPLPEDPGHRAHGAVEFLAVSLFFALAARWLYTRHTRPARRSTAAYVPYNERYEERDDVAAVACAHPRLPALSNVRGARVPGGGLRPADTSTALVLGALASGPWKRDVWAVTQKARVTTNRFDVDAFLSVWAVVNRAQALAHDGVLRHAARIGAFKEAFLVPDLITSRGGEDGISFVREATTALKLVCWIVSLERRLFPSPYEPIDRDAKMAWFLSRFGRVLTEPESVWVDWQEEYSAVVAGYDQLAGAGCRAEAFPEVGLAVMEAPAPLHSVALASHAAGADVLLCLFEGRRYELVCRPTQAYVYAGRPVFPRLDMAPLAALLDRLERGMPQGVSWVADRFTEDQPLLRLEARREPLTKAQRCGHPTDRPFYSSSIPPAALAAVVRSYLAFGLAAAPAPRRGGFGWAELLEVHRRIPWESWAQGVLQQYDSGQLTPRDGARGAARRQDAVPSGKRTPPTASQSPARGGAPAAPAAATAIELVTAASLPAELKPAAAAGAAAAAAMGIVALLSPRKQPQGQGQQAQGQGLPPLPGGLLRVASGPMTPLSPASWSGSFSGSFSGRGARHGPPAANTALYAGAASGSFSLPHSSVFAPRPLPAAGPAGPPPPQFSQPSALLTPADAQSIAAALPPLHRFAPWRLVYSSSRDGTSLHTLLRKAAGAAPTLLIVRDCEGGLFGAYAAEAWHVAPRFYGTGETFVFSLAPHRAVWPWVQAKGLPNDFFQFVGQDGLGVGGSGHWAIFLDDDLLHGSSGECATFASPPLGGAEDFDVWGVELWALH